MMTLIDFLGACWSRLLELVTDPRDGRLSAYKIGMIVACTTFTRHMVATEPADLWLWGLYMMTVGGFYMLSKFMGMKLGGGQQQEPPK